MLAATVDRAKVFLHGSKEKKETPSGDSKNHLGFHADVKLLHTGGQPGHDLKNIRQTNQDTRAAGGDQRDTESGKKKLRNNDRLRKKWSPAPRASVCPLPRKNKSSLPRPSGKTKRGTTNF